MDGNAAREKKLRQLAAMLELANHPGTPENEVQAALLRAQELMMKHDISISEIEESQLKPDETPLDYLVDAQDGRCWWKEALANIVASNFRCIPYFHIGRGTHPGTGVFLRNLIRTHFVGRTDDAQVAAAVYVATVCAVQNLGNTYIATEFIRDPLAAGRRKTVRDSYYAGFIDGLRSAFERQVSSMALAVIAPKAVQDLVQELTGGEIMKPDRVAIEDWRATSAGYEDGKQFGSNDRKGVRDRPDTIPKMIGG